MAKRRRKQQRQQRLRELLAEDPFCTDLDLARQLQVSPQTVRLDRMELNIPEVRRRTQELAHYAYQRVRSVSRQEVLGELRLLELGRRAVSALRTTNDMLFHNGHAIQGQFIYGQAETLALALIDAPAALTGMANVKYLQPVGAGELLVARAEHLRRRRNQNFVRVHTLSGETEVFRAKFVVAALDRRGQ